MLLTCFFKDILSMLSYYDCNELVIFSMDYFCKIVMRI